MYIVSLSLNYDPFKVYAYCMGIGEQVQRSTAHLSIFNFICHLLVHSHILHRSSCNCSASYIDVIDL